MNLWTKQEPNRDESRHPLKRQQEKEWQEVLLPKAIPANMNLKKSKESLWKNDHLQLRSLHQSQNQRTHFWAILWLRKNHWDHKKMSTKLKLWKQRRFQPIMVSLFSWHRLGMPKPTTCLHHQRPMGSKMFTIADGFSVPRIRSKIPWHSWSKDQLTGFAKPTNW